MFDKEMCELFLAFTFSQHTIMYRESTALVNNST